MASIQNIPPPSPRKQRFRKVKKAPKDAMEWTKKQYNQQYDRWVPWLEDQYLKYFTKDNKASYATKDQLAKTKVTGDSRVDKVQDDVSGAAVGQVGQGGLAQPVGDIVSKEAVNRAERGGKDEHGGYVPSVTGDGEPSQLDKVVEPVAEGAKDAVAETSEAASKTGEAAGKTGEGVKEGAGKAGGYFGGWFGGKKAE
ncbi:hypothetical protein BFW01_g7865 [Lasiodiplodia theobromae]|uniref:uncharacterized protein n=1 Tax=Lasiodiplodia theobromae TaxID=45133 RepID=UPI0015C3AAC4|nr:uncharacterized protein LTHEOB_3335 [Lasiodiplodia theobromae]KAF4534527.1 hypothetical protein LTHEOB_3335 [Lasiodiplodia theobromae]KAF9636969.1 hypothetical protein BFW01_g7865 [Lasiodiplodia theobromae]